MIALLVPASAALLVGLAVYGAGWLLVRFMVRKKADSPLERWVWGLAGWTLLLFALASLGLFRPRLLTALAWLFAAFGAWALFRAVQGIPALRSPSIWPSLLPGAAFAGPLVCILAVTVNPTISWDAAVYHLTLPDLYLRKGGFEEIPFLVYAVWPQAVELLFGVALAVHGYVAAKALHFGFGVLVVSTLFASAAPQTDQVSRTVRWLAGTAAAALFLLNDVVLFELRAAYVDLAMAFFALAAFLLLEHWLNDENEQAMHLPKHHLLVSAGLACGLLAATKINGILTAACLVALALPRLVGLRTNRRHLVRASLALGLPLAVLWTPWLLRTGLITGNPFYFLFWDVFGGPDWSAKLSGQFFAWQRSIGMGRELLDYLLLPWRVFTAGGTGYEHFDGKLTPLWLLFLPLAAWRALASPRARRALAVAGLLFVVWAMGSQQMRFLIPALPLLALAVADGVVGLLLLLTAQRQLRKPRRGHALIWAAVLAWLAAFGVTQTRLVTAGWNHLKLYGDPRFERPADPPRPPIFDAIASLPAGSTVLLLNSNHLFHCRPTTCWANSFFEAPQVDEWLSNPDSDADPAEWVAERLASRGVTHVAWTGQPRYRPAQPILDLLKLLEQPNLAEQVFALGPDTPDPGVPDRLWRLAGAQSSKNPESLEMTP